MEVFIGNLPGTATLIEITAFLEGVDLHTHFECHQGWDHQDRNYHYLIARTATPEDGRALIDHLHGGVFAGQRIEAREYRPRHPAESHPVERRINHRRTQAST